MFEYPRVERQSLCEERALLERALSYALLFGSLFFAAVVHIRQTDTDQATRTVGIAAGGNCLFPYGDGRGDSASGGSTRPSQFSEILPLFCEVFVWFWGKSKLKDNKDSSERASS